ncbi:MAG: hypothetical protein JXA10_05810 [Anaerolineae bacterium]|nr:hypothetical protein [Anaerolineae bacterium]
MIRRFIALIGLVSLVSLWAGSVSPARAQDETGWLLAQINDLRASVGLSAYTLNAQLSAAAARQSQYLSETCNITHTWPDGTTPADRAAQAGYTGSRIIENIYAGANARPVDAWTFWINSPIHYNGLVHNAINEVGIGIVHGGYCGSAYTLVFGFRGDGTAPPAVVDSGADTGIDSESVAAVVAQVYVPPAPTHTPTPTIPTLTPSATWTITPTFTPTSTGLLPTATGTALVLPTVPAMNQRASATPTPSATPEADTPAVNVPEAGPSTATGQAVAAAQSPIPPTQSPPNAERAAGETAAAEDDEGGFAARDLVPVALVVQIILIGVVAFWYFRRTQ